MDRTSLLDKLRPSKWTVLASVATLAAVVILHSRRESASRKRLEAALKSDPGLLRKYTTFQSYTTPSGYKYRRIRTFYKEHQNAAQLPRDLPLLVFMHGLGGSASQFDRLLTNLINVAPCLAIDLPGCGLSDFSPNNEKAYTTQALAELLATAISRYRDAKNGQNVILIGHSMGCSISTLLASSTSPLFNLLEGSVAGMVAICPRGASLTDSEAKAVNLMTSMPVPLFNMFRSWDRRGGLASASVSRVVGEHADDETRRKQLTYNEQSESGPFLRILRASTGATGMPGQDVWAGVKVPLFLIAADGDRITPAEEVERIKSWLTTPSGAGDDTNENDGHITVPALPTTTGDTSAAEKNINLPVAKPVAPRTDNQLLTKHSSVLKISVFPSPAAHGLMYTKSTVLTLSGLVENFFSEHIDKRLGPNWQLHTLETSGKWDVKNFKKWEATPACSDPIGGVFRAMKTMREVDPVHSPKEFVKRYSHKVLPDGVAAVVDISHDTPAYHPAGLEDQGVEYYKFPTVSKEKPKLEEVEGFVHLIAKILSKPAFKPDPETGVRPTIGVHCHYGYNRTGYHIVSWLVERESWALLDAIQEFEKKRPPGIRHLHFIQELHVRYGLKSERWELVEEQA